MKVSFTYAHPVTSPPHLVGEKGETRDLDKVDAERLQREGWGVIEPKTKKKPTAEPEDD